MAPAEHGVTSAMASTARQLGGAVGLAVLIAVANAAGGLGAGLWVGAVLVSATALLALGLPARQRAAN